MWQSTQCAKRGRRQFDEAVGRTQTLTVLVNFNGANGTAAAMPNVPQGCMTGFVRFLRTFCIEVLTHETYASYFSLAFPDSRQHRTCRPSTNPDCARKFQRRERNRAERHHSGD